MAIKARRGTDAQRAAITFDDGEICWTSDTKMLYMGDGVTLGGVDISGLITELNDLTAAVVWDDIPDANVPQSAVTQHNAALDHDALTGFVAAEHIDWSVTGVEDVHADRISEASVTAHEAALGILEAQISDLQAYLLDAPSDGTTYGRLNGAWVAAAGSEVNDLTSAVTWANIPDANVPQSAVTQHEGALSILEAQISDLQAYLTDAPIDGSEYVRLNGAWSVATGGGGGGINNVVEDLTPQLGGDLDVNGNSIVTTANGDVVIDPDGIGDVVISNATPQLSFKPDSTGLSIMMMTDAAGDTGSIWYYGHTSNTMYHEVRVLGTSNSYSIMRLNPDGIGLFTNGSAGAQATLAMLLDDEYKVNLKEVSSTTTPTSGFGSIYPKTDGKLYFKNDAGTETDLTAGGGGGLTNPLTADLESGGFRLLGSSATFPPVQCERTSAGTNNSISGAMIKHTTTSNMVDGFGASMSWAIEDVAGVENYIGSLDARRNGADNTGEMSIYTYTTGTPLPDQSWSNSEVVIKPGDNEVASFTNGQTTITGDMAVNGQLAVADADFPAIRAERTAAVGSGSHTSLHTKATYSGNMTAGFGSGHYYSVEDSGGEFFQGSINCTRASADDTHEMNFNTYIGGTETTKATIDENGDFLTTNRLVAGTDVVSTSGVYKSEAGSGNVNIIGTDGGATHTGVTRLTPGKLADNTSSYADLLGADGSTTAPRLQFREARTDGLLYVGLKAPDNVGATVVWTLPDDTHTNANGKFLTSDASGNLSFAVPAGGSGINDVIEDTTPQLGGNLDTNEFLIENGGAFLDLEDNASSELRSAPGNDINVRPVDNTGGNGGRTNIGGGNSTSGSGGYAFIYGGNGTNTNDGRVFLAPGHNTVNGEIGGGIWVQGRTGSTEPAPMRFCEALSNGFDHITLQAPASVGTSRTWVLPSDDPSTADGQFITTDASGNLSFNPALQSVVGDTTPQLGGDLDVQTNAIVSTGTNNITFEPGGTQAVVMDGNTQQVTVAGPTFPPFTVKRDQRTTDTVWATFACVAEKTTNMGDGFGTAFYLRIRDDAGVDNTIGAVAASRNGADNTGSIFLRPYNSGTAVDALEVEPDGTLNVSGVTNYEALVISDDDIPNKKYVDDAIGYDLGEFTVAGLPTASANSNGYALATDASGGRTIVRSDGTNWKVVAVEGATVTT